MNIRLLFRLSNYDQAKNSLIISGRRREPTETVHCNLSCNIQTNWQYFYNLICSSGHHQTRPDHTSVVFPERRGTVWYSLASYGQSQPTTPDWTLPDTTQALSGPGQARPYHWAFWMNEEARPISFLNTLQRVSPPYQFNSDNMTRNSILSCHHVIRMMMMTTRTVP